MAEEQLDQFVAAALGAGAGRARIREALAQAGWSGEQIEDALGAYAEVDFPVPVPRPRVRLSARDAFFYLVIFVALYISAYQLGSLLFQFVNLAFPDALHPGWSVERRIRWAISALLVAWPAFLVLSVRNAREVAREPVRRGSAVRRWLIHLTLALAAVIVLGDLIALVNGLLSGELTVRFVLKAAIVGLIAGSVFGYYLHLSRADDAALAER